MRVCKYSLHTILCSIFFFVGFFNAFVSVWFVAPQPAMAQPYDTIFSRFGNVVVNNPPGNAAQERLAEIATHLPIIASGTLKKHDRTRVKMGDNAQIAHASNYEASEDYGPDPVKSVVQSSKAGGLPLQLVVPLGKPAAHSVVPGDLLFLDAQDLSRGQTSADQVQPTVPVVSHGGNVSIIANMARPFLGVAQIKFDAEAHKANGEAKQISSVMMHGTVSLFNSSQETLYAGMAVGATLVTPFVPNPDGTMTPAIRRVGHDETAFKGVLHPISRYDYADYANHNLIKQRAFLTRTSAGMTADEKKEEFSLVRTNDLPTKLEKECTKHSVVPTSNATASHSLAAKAVWLLNAAYLSLANYYEEHVLPRFLVLMQNEIPQEMAASALTLWMNENFTTHFNLYHGSSGKIRTAFSIAQEAAKLWCEMRTTQSEKANREALQYGFFLQQASIFTAAENMASAQKMLTIGVAISDAKPNGTVDVLIGG
jgi:hypothetical protein